MVWESLTSIRVPSACDHHPPIHRDRAKLSVSPVLWIPSPTLKTLTISVRVAAQENYAKNECMHKLKVSSTRPASCHHNLNRPIECLSKQATETFLKCAGSKERLAVQPGQRDSAHSQLHLYGIPYRHLQILVAAATTTTTTTIHSPIPKSHPQPSTKLTEAAGSLFYPGYLQNS